MADQREAEWMPPSFPAEHGRLVGRRLLWTETDIGLDGTRWWVYGDLRVPESELVFKATVTLT